MLSSASGMAIDPFIVFPTLSLVTKLQIFCYFYNPFFRNAYIKYFCVCLKR